MLVVVMMVMVVMTRISFQPKLAGVKSSFALMDVLTVILELVAYFHQT